MTDPFSEVLEVRATGANSFRTGPHSGSGFLYGGATMAVAMMSAGATGDAYLVPLSMRTAFLTFGAWSAMDAEVEEVHNSRSFAHRRVVLGQDHRRIAAADVSFHAPEEGPERQHHPAPDASRPESLPRLETITGGLDLMDLRPVRPVPAQPSGRVHPYWARIHDDVGSTPLANAAAIAFMSDYMVILSPFEPGSGEARTWRSFTLEHSIWFHSFARADDWLLFDAVPLVRAGGRYVSRGTVHDRRGHLVASFVQEGFTRPVVHQMVDSGPDSP